MHMTLPETARAPAKIEAVIFDWAGTLVDFGSLAPTQIFVEAFASFGIAVSLAEARGPMGLSKREHIRTLLAEPAIATQWQEHFERDASEEDIDAIYERFMPMQIEKVGDYSQAIPGAASVMAWLRDRGAKVGSCSGYPRRVMDVLLPMAAREGLVPDHVVAGDDLAAGGRPGPFMALANVIALGVSDVRRCIKVDDTTPGIEEGRNAGMWTVGLSVSGNEVGCTMDELAALDETERADRRDKAIGRLRSSGAHYVIDSIADLPQVIFDIERRIALEHTPDCVSPEIK